MRDRTEQILRGVCLVLAVLVFCAFIRGGCRAGALIGAKIPPVPTLETNSVAATNLLAVKLTNVPPGKASVTNSTKSVVGTNVAGVKTNSNSETIGTLTNSARLEPSAPSSQPSPPLGAKESAGRSADHDLGQTSSNLLHSAKTNSPNLVSVRAGGTNLPGTNLLAAGTNSTTTNTPSKKSRKDMPPEMARGMMGGGFPGMPGKPAKLPPEIQARLDKIVESELFAPVPHPQPLMLQGIAGETVFLQTPSGQTGLLKTNEPLDGIKLLRIGINRVLVEQDGEKKELMIFDGYGGESLLPKENSK